MKKIQPQRIIISRTDAIGDVVLTLPVAGLLKKQFPECVLIFLGRTYTEPVIDCCEHIDEFINYDDFLKLKPTERIQFLSNVKADVIIHVFPRNDLAWASGKANIPVRIGTTNRLYHWWTCNRLVASGRKNSALHEAQLNAKLLKPLGVNQPFQTVELKNYFGLNRIKPLPERLKRMLQDDKINVLLHPKSNISAREWSLDRYHALIQQLPPEKFNIVITGTENEKRMMQHWLKTLPTYVQDVTGKMNLHELISFIRHADGLVAASTGPLHLAGALGRQALGIYPPIRPMHPGRWAPLGESAGYLVMDKSCSDCRNNSTQCHCMNEIRAKEVALKLLKWKKLR